jgi:site-specific recombinase XerD
MKTLKISKYLESFFIVRLIKQKRYTGNTIQSYSTTFQLLLDFASKRLRKKPYQLVIEDINSKLVSDFLDQLEAQRKTSARTRNVRISAIKSFFNYLSQRLPELAEMIGQVLAIPYKRTNKKLVNYLNDEEVKMLLNVPDQKTLIGKRDYILILMLIQTGCRLSELIELRWRNVRLEEGGYIDFFGKGRKARWIPLSKQLSRSLQLWSKDIDSAPSDILFPTIHGTQMSPDVIQYLIKKYSKIAAKKCPSLDKRNISPHVLRHTTAMRMLASGADLSSIALWLGHESIETTYIYLSMDMPRMERILKKLPVIKTRASRYRPKDSVMKFLNEIIKKGENYI